MNEEEISETLNRVVPHREVPEGMLAGARRRRRRTRVFTGTAAVALVAALAVPLGMTMGGSAHQVATPAPMPSGAATSLPIDGVLCPPGETTPGATLGAMTRGYACGPVGFPFLDSNESVQIPLSDDLITQVVQEALSTQQPVKELSSRPDGPYLQFPHNVQSLVLLGPDGTSVTMVGTPDGYSWYAPEHLEFEPSWELADRIWEEIGRDSNCSVPGYLYPAEVSVDVYDAGGGEASVERVSQHFREAGFVVTNTGVSAPANMGGAIIMRGSNDHLAAMSLVSSYFDTSGGVEMSRENGVVDVLVTAVFNDAADPFALDPVKRVVDGFLTCTSPSEAEGPSVIPTDSTNGLAPPVEPLNSLEPVTED